MKWWRIYKLSECLIECRDAFCFFVLRNRCGVIIKRDDVLLLIDCNLSSFLWSFYNNFDGFLFRLCVESSGKILECGLAKCLYGMRRRQERERVREKNRGRRHTCIIRMCWTILRLSMALEIRENKSGSPVEGLNALTREAIASGSGLR